MMIYIAIILTMIAGAVFAIAGGTLGGALAALRLGGRAMLYTALGFVAVMELSYRLGWIPEWLPMTTL